MQESMQSSESYQKQKKKKTGEGSKSLQNSQLINIMDTM